MFKEEKYIEKQFGKANHFNVPNGYFEGFTSKMMDKLSADDKTAEQAHVIPIDKPGFWRRYRRVVGGVAAGLCVAVLSLGAYLHGSGVNDARPNVQQQARMVSPQQKTDSSFDAVVDYSMMDTDDMYAYMADAI